MPKSKPIEEWKSVPEDTDDITAYFPDGFRMSYREMWDLGKPSEDAHWALGKVLVAQHGGPPIFKRVK